jgi:hypothetical protein
MLFMILSCSGLVTLFVLPAVLKTWEARFFNFMEKEKKQMNKLNDRGQPGTRSAGPGKHSHFGAGPPL